ncbi:MAG TPA: arginine--tRNA ligase [bacterium]
MKQELAAHVGAAVAKVAADRGLQWRPDPAGLIEQCRDERFGDFTTSAAMELASRAVGRKIPPRELGQAILAALPAGDGLIAKAEVAGPGFINITIRRERWLAALAGIAAQDAAYGRSDLGQGRRVQVEFVSANPTGPLHLGHGRGAAVGDILCRVLEATGHAVVREFYVNDAGRQVETLARSVLARCREQLGGEARFPEDGYKGDYVRDLARDAVARHGASLLALPDEQAPATLGEEAMATILAWIRRDLEAFGVRFDVWFSERSLYRPGAWEALVEQLRARDLLFEQEGALWFRSTAFGDDKDRVVVKNDGSRTYLASDILYHADKFRRGFERVIDIWGADHHGYIPRMQAVVQALGQPADALAVRLIQLVTLTRGGKAVAMGKREGEFTTLAEVVAEVGADAARFFFVTRRCESHLEFDLELAKAKTADNPVFYVQYAHARIASIFRTQAERGAGGLDDAGADLERLALPEELSLIKRAASFPDVLAACARGLEPHPLAQYLVGLAAAFHGYYNRVRVISEDVETSRARLALARGVGVVLRNGLGLMGVPAPDQM